MAENIKEVIARLKNNHQNSQASKPAPAPKPAKVVEQEVVDADEDYVDEEEEMPTVEEKPVVKAQKQEIKADPQIATEQIQQQLAMEIEMLQNNGRFRVELLHQMQEINKALVVIAGVLVDLAGKNDKE